MRWHLYDNSISWLWSLDIGNGEGSPVPLLEVALSEDINTYDREDSSVGNEIPAHLNFVACKISVANELLTWLVYSKGLWEFLSS